MKPELTYTAVLDQVSRSILYTTHSDIQLQNDRMQKGKIRAAIRPQLNKARGKVEPRTLQIWSVSFWAANPRRFRHEIRIRNH